MTRHRLRHLIACAAQAEFSLEIEPVVTRAPVGFGEWTSSAPLEIARFLKREAAPIGQTLISRLQLAFPGAIQLQNGRLNFFMSDDFLQTTLERATRDGAHFGAGETLAGQRILVEYVSADPTGPLPFVAGRHAALGESLCRLLELQGARVSREFYLNDLTSSSKIRWLGEGVAAWYQEAFGRGNSGQSNLKSASNDSSNDGFVRGVAAELARRDGAKWLGASDEDRIAAGAAAALESAVAAQKATLERFGVRFDDWVSEANLRRDGHLERALQRLQERGYTYERDGALWLQTSKFGDETDRVLRRSNGQITYFAGDIAYHFWKGERGFDRVINLWGAEHRPYIARTKAALEAAGLELDKFEFLVCEGAVLKRDGATLRLGSGGGPLLLDEEMSEIEPDALKFHFLRQMAGKTAEIELEIARRDDESNPAYAALLVPSRLARLSREAQGQIGQNQIGSESETATSNDLEWLPGERELARLVGLWPDEAAEAAERRDPARIARFALELGEATRILLIKTSPSSAPLAQRLQLLRAAANVATSALKMLGIEARDKF